MTTYICGGDDWDWCDKHQAKLHGYPCHQCQVEWEHANPKTAEAISRFAQGKATLADIARARRLDRIAQDQP